MSARAVARAYSIDELRWLAKKRLPRAIFGFIDGGAEDEMTLRDNRAAFERVRLAPRMLTGVAGADTGTSILGGRARPPIAIAPTGGVRRGADVVKALALGTEAVMIGGATLYGAGAVAAVAGIV
jgi:(S)-mandelate dehydrogenase